MTINHLFPFSWAGQHGNANHCQMRCAHTACNALHEIPHTSWQWSAWGIGTATHHIRSRACTRCSRTESETGSHEMQIFPALAVAWNLSMPEACLVEACTLNCGMVTNTTPHVGVGSRVQGRTHCFQRCVRYYNPPYGYDHYRCFRGTNIRMHTPGIPCNYCDHVVTAEEWDEACFWGWVSLGNEQCRLRCLRADHNDCHLDPRAHRELVGAILADNQSCLRIHGGACIRCADRTWAQNIMDFR